MLVLLLVAFPLALVACGGDSSSKSPRSDAGGASGTTDASGASGASGAATGASGSASKTKRASGSGGASADTGGSSAAGAAGGTSKSEPAAKAPAKKAKKPHFLPGAFAGQQKQLYDQSKRVCDALTLEGLAHEYDVTPKTPEAVARRYSQAYPPKIRKSVYKGCKAGLSK